MSFRKHGAHGLATALAALSIALAAGCGSDDDASTSAIATQGSVPPASSVEGQFAVFRGPRRAADEIPEDLLPAKIAEGLGLDLTTSRLARTYAGDPIYIVRSPRLTCTYSWNYEVGNCWPTTTVQQGLATATAICGLGGDTDQVVTYGLVPDGVSEVTILRRTEPDRTVPVVGNVYVGETSATPPLPLRLAFMEDGIRIVRPTGIPPALARKGCQTRKPPPPSSAS